MRYATDQGEAVREKGFGLRAAQIGVRRSPAAAPPLACEDHATVAVMPGERDRDFGHAKRTRMHAAARLKAEFLVDLAAVEGHALAKMASLDRQAACGLMALPMGSHRRGAGLAQMHRDGQADHALRRFEQTVSRRWRSRQDVGFP